MNALIPTKRTSRSSDFLKNQRMSVKVATPAVVSLFCLITIAAFAFVMFNQLASDFRQLNDGAFERFKHVQTLESALGRVHAALFRITSLAANESDPSRLNGNAAEVEERLSLLDKLGARLTENEKDLELTKQLGAYIRSSREVVEVVRTDSAMALLLMANAQEAFVGLDRRLTRAAQAADELRGDTFQSAIASIGSAVRLFAIIVVAAVGCTALASFLITKAIGRPIGELTQVMMRLAGGERDVDVGATTRRDEIGSMARALEVFKGTAIEADRLASERLEQDNRMRKQAEDLRTTVRRFEEESRSILTDVGDAATGMNHTASKLASTVESTQEQASEAAATSMQASTNVETVASAAEELTASIEHVSQQIAESARMARASAQRVSDATGKMRALELTAQKIGGVVGLIVQVASQTNLLALNASIEAARAGEAGKGFAVVANEVKALASQTEKATAQIRADIEEIQAASTDAVGVIAGIGNAIVEIDSIAAEIAAAIDQQRLATREIAKSAAEAAAGTRAVSENIRSVDELGNATGSCAKSVLGAAQEFTGRAQRLASLVDDFLQNVRAA
jgi:methyl-accepting chemotaxis protein